MDAAYTQTFTVNIFYPRELFSVQLFVIVRIIITIFSNVIGDQTAVFCS